MRKITHESLLIQKKEIARHPFVMATVVQSDPLNIIIDGDTEPLPYTPKKIKGASLLQNDRVVVAIINSHYLVLGAIE